jgi:hypothetical protein
MTAVEVRVSSTSDQGIPGGPPGTPGTGNDTPLGRRDDGATIGERVGHDPGNLGDDVADSGDVTHPTPDPENRGL